MTTIAYDHKNRRIAIDSRITAGGVIQTDSGDKIIRNEKGVWLLCGDCCDQETMAGMSHNDEYKLHLDCSAFVLKDNFIYKVIQNRDKVCEWNKITHSSTLGSGGKFATAAMDHGKSAKEAIEYAKTRCVYTGGKVHVFDVSGQKV